MINAEQIKINDILAQINKKISLTDKPSKHVLKIKNLTLVEFYGKNPLELFCEIEVIGLYKKFNIKVPFDISYEELKLFVENGMMTKYSFEQSVNSEYKPKTYITRDTKNLDDFLEYFEGMTFDSKGRILTGIEANMRSTTQNIYKFA